MVPRRPPQAPNGSPIRSSRRRHRLVQAGTVSAKEQLTSAYLGVRQVVIPWTGTLGAAQRAVEQQRSWRRRYRWRAGIEERIYSLRRDYGLARCRSHGEVGLERDVGWGVLASALRHLATAQAQRKSSAPKAAA